MSLFRPDSERAPGSSGIPPHSATTARRCSASKRFEVSLLARAIPRRLSRTKYFADPAAGNANLRVCDVSDQPAPPGRDIIRQYVPVRIIAAVLRPECNRRILEQTLET